MKSIVSSLEILEARIAPAALTTLTGTGTTIAHYTDVDGDLVTITATGGTGSRIFAGSMFSGVAPTAGHEQLQLLNLSTNANFEGANLIFTVVHVAGGNGLANVGRIDSTGHNLGNVTVLGDLGQIDAGSGTASPPAISALKVHSLGRLGTDTQAGGGTLPLQSDILGKLGSLTVTDDVIGAFINVTGANGKIGPIIIHGSLIGDTHDFSGAIFSAGDMGAVTIDHNVEGGLGDVSGHIESHGLMGTLTIHGSLLGGLGGNTGEIISNGAIGKVTIGHNVEAGSGDVSGIIEGGGSMGVVGGVHIGGSLLGGPSLDGSGKISCPLDMGAVTIGHDVKGGSGDESGVIKCGGNLASVHIGGSLLGGSGSISGANYPSGTIGSGGNMGAVTIDHDVRGGGDRVSGNIGSGGTLGNVHIYGSLIGGTRDRTGMISSIGNMGAVTIGHDLIGGAVTNTDSLDQSGYIASGGRIASVDIGGSIISGVDSSTLNQPGGDLTDNASIRAHDDIGSLSVDVALVGNAGDGTPGNLSPIIISARGQHAQGATTDLAIGPITIGATTLGGRVEFADILAGYDTDLTAVNADAQIGAVIVRGDWVASNLIAGASNSGFPKFGDSNDVKIAGGTDTLGIMSKIASINIKGQVFGTPLSVSGADHFGFVAERIFSLTIGTTPTAYVIALTATPHTDNFAVGETGDLFVHEV